MSDIKTEMPVLARHEGEWEGRYVHLNPDNAVIDRHRSRVSCRFAPGDPHPYQQRNVYVWEDGRKEENLFPARYADKRIHWDTPRILGHAWEIDGRTVCLTWTRKDMPGTYFYEMIQISDDNNDRARTWHWFEDGKLVRRTCIQESRVAERAPGGSGTA